MVPTNARFVEKITKLCIQFFIICKNEYVGYGMKTIGNPGVQHTVYQRFQLTSNIICVHVLFNYYLV